MYFPTQMFVIWHYEDENLLIESRSSLTVCVIKTTVSCLEKENYSYSTPDWNKRYINIFVIIKVMGKVLNYNNTSSLVSSIILINTCNDLYFWEWNRKCIQQTLFFYIQILVIRIKEDIPRIRGMEHFLTIIYLCWTSNQMNLFLLNF